MPNPIPTAEVARILNVDVRTIHRWVTNGRLTPVMKLPGRRGAYLFDRDAVESLASGRAA